MGDVREKALDAAYEAFQKAVPRHDSWRDRLAVAIEAYEAAMLERGEKMVPREPTSEKSRDG